MGAGRGCTANAGLERLGIIKSKLRVAVGKQACQSALNRMMSRLTTLQSSLLLSTHLQRGVLLQGRRQQGGAGRLDVVVAAEGRRAGFGGRSGFREPISGDECSRMLSGCSCRCTVCTILPT